MAVEITDKMYKALVAELKKSPGNSERHYAEATGIPQGQIGSVLYRAEVEADPKLKIPATGKSIADARAKGIRWPRIAARTNKSLSEVKNLYEDHTGQSASESYAGRGRNFTSSGGGTTTKSSGTSGRRGGKAATSAPARGTSGRRAAGKRGAASTGKRGAASPK